MTFYNQQTHSGDLIYLPRWQYAIVVETPETVRMDDYEGRWGDIVHSQRLKRAYAVCALIRAAERTGRRVLQRVGLLGQARLCELREELTLPHAPARYPTGEASNLW